MSIPEHARKRLHAKVEQVFGKCPTSDSVPSPATLGQPGDKDAGKGQMRPVAEDATNSKGKFTPGPWTLETVKTQIGICHKVGPFPPVQTNGNPSHCCIYVDHRSKATDAPELFANARLIAASPDLLNACQLALSALDILMGDTDLDSDDSVEMKACQALTKAIEMAEKGQP